MNIFELLKHENHYLEVITLKKNVLLGCVNCGTTIAELDDISHYITNMAKYKDILIEKECENLLATLTLFEDKILGVIHQSVKDFILHGIEDNIATEFKYEEEPETGVWLDLYSYLFDEGTLYDCILDQYNDIDYLYDLYHNNFEKLKGELYELTYNILKENSDYIILSPGQNYTISNHIISAPEDKLPQTLIILSKKEIEKSEKENPTVTDVLTFDDEKEFCSFFNNNENKVEFEYRVKMKLIDISNLDKKKITDTLIHYYGLNKYAHLLELF